MARSFTPPDYFRHLRARWRFFAVACGVAAVAVSLLLPRKYTAVARIMIDPPAANNPRIAIAVSPMYLESLRTYELFASSDELFQQAVGHFHGGLARGVPPAPSSSSSLRS